MESHKDFLTANCTYQTTKVNRNNEAMGNGYPWGKYEIEFGFNLLKSRVTDKLAKISYDYRM